MPPTLKVALEPSCNGEFYTLEDHIAGNLILGLDKSLNIREVTVRLLGQTETLVRPGDHLENETPKSLQTPLEDNRSVHELVRLESSVFPPENVRTALEGSKKAFKVERGSYKFPFTFQLPQRPQCVQKHSKKLYTYVKGRSNVELPPSFNNSLDSKDILNLNTYFYSLGKIEYCVEATIYTGSEEMWFKPFKSTFASKRVFELIPSNLAQAHIGDVLTSDSATAPEIFKSKYDVTFEGDDDMVMWAEVRSRHLRSVYRLDYLFRQESGKFGQIFLCMSKPLPKDADLKIVSVELNLIELVTYLAGNRSNANISSLRLAGITTDFPLNISDVTETKNGHFEYSAKLEDIYPLDMIRFNEEDYRHNGNRLYSFASCNIKRRFKLQLFVGWSLNNRDYFQTEVLTNFTNVFLESITVEEQPPEYIEEEQLPRYE